MSKVITSPVKKWPGTVTLHDPLSLPQAAGIQRAMGEIRKIGEDVGVLEQHAEALPAMLDCIEVWNIDGIEKPSVDTFPGTPLEPAAELFRWLMREIIELFSEASSVPNE